MCHLVALWTVMLRCPRTYSGRPSARLGRSVWAATTVGVRSHHGRCAPSAVSRTATDGPHQRQVPAGPAPLGRARGRFDYHSGGTWLRRRSSCLRCTGPIRGQPHRQVGLAPRLRRSGRWLGRGDWLAAFAWVPSTPAVDRDLVAEAPRTVGRADEIDLRQRGRPFLLRLPESADGGNP